MTLACMSTGVREAILLVVSYIGWAILDSKNHSLCGFLSFNVPLLNYVMGYPYTWHSILNILVVRRR